MLPKETIAQFDDFLFEQELQFQGIVIGGAALGLLGVMNRQTRDCDILYPELPEQIVEAAKAFAEKKRAQGDFLQSDWLNNGPFPVSELLPDHWRKRLLTIYTGKAITLQTLGRNDLLLTKLFGYCDHGTDLADCLALAPSQNELVNAREWLHKQDAHPQWPNHVDDSLNFLARKLGYEL